MTEQSERSFDAVVIDASTNEPVDKEWVLALLKSHHVDTAPVEGSDTCLDDILPSLQKAKVDVPEGFYKDLSERLSMSFLEYSEVTEIYKEEQKSKLISILPYPIISKYKVIPLVNRGGHGGFGG